MKPQKQRFRHEPMKGIYGDCHRTAMACLLDLPVDRAPHFIGEFEEREHWKARGEYQEPYDWQALEEEWLNSLGYTKAEVSFDGATCDAEVVLNYMQVCNPHIYYLLGGRSPRGTNHSVICHGGGFAWDPHPDGGFLVGPLDNNFWTITFILPLSMKQLSNS